MAPKWTPVGLVQRLRRTIRQPGDLVLALRIGYFLWKVPRRLDRSDLPTLLRELRSCARPRSNRLESDLARIIRLRQAWLGLPFFSARNTCYTRAFTLYRFLEPGHRRLRIHLGIEEPSVSKDRMRGHAWVSVDGVVVEPPEPVVQGRVREIFRYPEDE